MPSLDESIAAGSYITHTGPCGTCSSLEDLAIMIEYPNLPYKGYQCFWTSNGMADLNAAVSCYQDIGFTLSCARTLASYQNNIVDEGCGYECSAWAYDGEAGGSEFFIFYFLILSILRHEHELYFYFCCVCGLSSYFSFKSFLFSLSELCTK